MKEFENWVHEYSHGEQISQRYELADAWRAALQWAMKQHCLYYSSYSFKVIERELND